MFEKEFNKVAKTASEISEKKGWTISSHSPEKLGNKIALMHSELSEALEYLRRGNPSSDHIPGFSGLEEEFADTIIRIMHFAHAKKLNVAGAILAKIKFNASREFKHGGKCF